jgi:hypothetical protein
MANLHNSMTLHVVFVILLAEKLPHVVRSEKT